jgi:glycosyltransferase involved in cell wall biosynthesis
VKVALVHDYLREYGGAERVLEALREIWPEAPVYTAFYNKASLGIHADKFKGWDIKTSWLQNLPFANELISPFRIFAPGIFEGFDFSEYDLVISSCNLYFSKAVNTKGRTLNLSYIHTPPRYLYGYTTSFNYKKHWWTRVLAESMNHYLRVVDFETSQKPQVLIANSENVAARIKKFYRRDSQVIYPPVDVEELLKVKKLPGKYYLTLNRLSRGKGTEVAVAACSKLSLPLKVASTGGELGNLKKIAGKSVEFVGEVTEKEKAKLFSEAIALIACSEDEDFGITVVEAQAAGVPVIAAKAGGDLETVIEGKTGEFYMPGFLGDFNIYVDPVSVDNLVNVLENFKASKFKESDLRKNAEKFSKENFKKKILKLVETS